METAKTGKKTAILCVIWLLIVAAAAFCSMHFYTRSVFGNNRDWELCFAALAACLLLSAAVKKPLFSLVLCVAAATGMAFVTAYYPALFFPISLQAALWEAARDDTKTGRAVYFLSLLLVPATIPLRLRLREFMRYNATGYGGSDPMGEAYACFAGLVLLLVLWCALTGLKLRQSRTKKKTPAKKRGRDKKKKTDVDRLPAVYLVCALHVVLAGLTCARLFSGEYIKLIFFSSGLFVFYLLYREDPALRALPRIRPQRGDA